jgi:hypothetical protein
MKQSSLRNGVNHCIGFDCHQVNLCNTIVPELFICQLLFVNCYGTSFSGFVVLFPTKLSVMPDNRSHSGQQSHQEGQQGSTKGGQGSNSKSTDAVKSWRLQRL